MSDPVSYGNSNVVCHDEYAPLENDMGQNPCLTYAWMVGSCADLVVRVDPLSSQDNAYAAPIASTDGDPNSGSALLGSSRCTCGRVPYNLISACGLCQGAKALSWDEYTAQCSEEDVSGWNFTSNVPTGASLPRWATQSLDSFSINQAIEDSDEPDFTASGVPTATTSASISFASQGTRSRSLVVSRTSAVPSETTAPQVFADSTWKLRTTSLSAAGFCLAFSMFVIGLYLFCRKRRRRQMAQSHLRFYQNKGRPPMVVFVHPMLFGAIVTIGLVTSSIATWVMMATLFTTLPYTPSPLQRHAVLFITATSWWTLLTATLILLCFKGSLVPKPDDSGDVMLLTRPSRQVHFLWSTPTWVLWFVAAILFTAVPQNSTKCVAHCTQMQALSVFAFIEFGLLTIIVGFIFTAGIASYKRQKAHENDEKRQLKARFRHDNRDSYNRNHNHTNSRSDLL